MTKEEFVTIVAEYIGEHVEGSSPFLGPVSHSVNAEGLLDFLCERFEVYGSVVSDAVDRGVAKQEAEREARRAKLVR